MAKMFYTLEEVCEKLGKSEDEVREMASSGQIQEFRDRDKLMFKVDQIDLLVGGDEDSGEVKLDLDDSSASSGLDLQDTGGGSAIGLVDSRESTGLDVDDSFAGISDDEPSSDSREGTGISVFDTGHGDSAGLESGSGSSPAMEDLASGDTQMGDTLDDDLSLDAVGSGSGLLDLTRESDDTSLGAELLEEVYSGDDNIEIPANASGLFEAAGADSSPEPIGEPMGAGSVPVVVEAYDGSGSGLGVGLMLGALAALIIMGIIVLVSVQGATPDLAMKMTSSSNSLYIWSGGLLGVTIILGLIGLFIGKASE